MLGQNSINSIDVNITYQDETEAVNFQRCDWEINLIISFYKIKEEKNIHHNTLHSEIINKIENMYKRGIQEEEDQLQLNKLINNKMKELKI